MRIIDTVKYLGIPYKHGGDDKDVGVNCYGLAKLFYRQEFNIEALRLQI